MIETEVDIYSLLFSEDAQRDISVIEEISNPIHCDQFIH